jgi:hypothetical protein
MTSEKLSIAGGAATKIALQSMADVIQASTEINYENAPLVAIVDAGGNTVNVTTDFEVTLNVSGLSPGSLVTPTSTFTASAHGGISNFSASGLKISKAGKFLTYQFGTQSIMPIPTREFKDEFSLLTKPFHVAGDPAYLTFTVQPPTQVSNGASFDIEVTVYDHLLTPVMISNSIYVDISIGENPSCPQHCAQLSPVSPRLLVVGGRAKTQISLSSSNIPAYVAEVQTVETWVASGSLGGSFVLELLGYDGASRYTQPIAYNAVALIEDEDDGATITREVHTIVTTANPGNISGGSYSLTYGNKTTWPISTLASTKELKTAIDSLSAVGVVKITRTEPSASNGYTYQVTFVTYKGTLTLPKSSIIAGGALVQAEKQTPGVYPFGKGKGESMQAKLQNLPGIVCQVQALQPDPISGQKWVINFANSLPSGNFPGLSLMHNSLTGSSASVSLGTVLDGTAFSLLATLKTGNITVVKESRPLLLQ